MIDFLNDIKEIFTKKVIIITLSALALVIIGIASAIMIHNSIPDKTVRSRASRVSAEIYTLEIESSSDVSAESIYQKLAKDNNELKLLSMENEQHPHVVKLSSESAKTSSLEICFADGEAKKNFTAAGKYEETLIVHNQIDQSISSLTVNLIVKNSNIVIETNVATTESTATSSTTIATTTSVAASKATTSKVSDATYYNDDYYEEYEDYEYDEEDYYYSDDDYYYDDYTEEQPVDNDNTDNNTDETNNNNNNISDVPTDKPENNTPKFETAEDFGWTGEQVDQFNYAISQGCNVWQASAYANACMIYGEENIFIGTTPEDSTCWGVWYYDDVSGMYRAA